MRLPESPVSGLAQTPGEEIEGRFLPDLSRGPALRNSKKKIQT